jgi:hypothetical protein
MWVEVFFLENVQNTFRNCHMAWTTTKYVHMAWMDTKCSSFSFIFKLFWPWSLVIEKTIFPNMLLFWLLRNLFGFFIAYIPKCTKIFKFLEHSITKESGFEDQCFFLGSSFWKFWFTLIIIILGLHYWILEIIIWIDTQLNLVQDHMVTMQKYGLNLEIQLNFRTPTS